MKKIFAAVISAAVIACTAIGGIGGYKSGTAYASTHTHTFSQTWSKGKVNHWHASTCEHDISRDVAPHDYGADNTCKVCGYVKNEHVHSYDTSVWVNDTKNHWHAANCGHNVVTDIAKHTYDSTGKCVCGYERPSANHTHTFEKTWSGDSLNHWKAADCGHKIVYEMAAHTTNANGVCTVCGKQVSEVKPIELPSSVKAAGGYNESLYAEWETTSITGVKAYYQAAGASGWIEVDKNLIRLEKGVARVDAVGLKEGAYNLKISSGAGADMTVSNIPVTAYDRSGYAHFKYTDGVGAYNDDGTLKEGALVIYVTDGNKNDVSDYVYKNTANGLVKENISKYIKPGVPTSNGKSLGGETYGSIGYILNNRGYENNTEREKYGIQALTQAYGAVAVRVLGRVESALNSDKCSPTLTGLTYYAKNGQINPITGETYKKGVSVPNGGTVGDNGQMARIVNAKNLTIEGIGEDAKIFGWGVHFVSNDNLHKIEGAGKSFEVRNITFENYPEDAVGMEGTQGVTVDPATGSIKTEGNASTARIISPVERCWIHNNVFLPGFCAEPAESDKGEGDGSCDFKRGQYYTLSYNYFTDCHKTNLIGSSDDSLQFNITMHHNWWNNCGSRIPLLRNANAHFYNNYVQGEPEGNLSYVHSMRANSYLFSEANYYNGCKQVTRKESESGRAKSWNNIFYSCYEVNEMIIVDSRTQSISNTCKYTSQNIDYSKFDTDSGLFYYDSVNRKSDCLLDDATTARVKVMMNAGVNGFGKPEEETAINGYTPTTTVQLQESGETVIALPSSKGDSEVNGVLFRGFTGAGKGKGQIITFTLPAGGAVISVTASGKEADHCPELVDSTGKVWASKFTDLTMELPQGTYFIASGQKDKEATISALSFSSSAESSAVRVQAATDAINAIPVNVTLNDEALVKAAQTAYSGLLASEKNSFDASLKNKLDNAVSALNSLKANEVIALINAIGTVDEDSYDKINAAQTAYNALTSAQKDLVTNANVLSAAQTAFAGYAVSNFRKTVDGLVDVSKIDVSDKTAIENAKAEYTEAKGMYADLDEEQREQVESSLTKITQGLEEIKKLEKLFVFKAALADADAENVTVSSGGALKTLYLALSDAQKAALTEAEKSKYNAIIAVYDSLASQSVSTSWTSGTDNYNNSFFTFNGKTRTNSAETVTVDNVTYTTSLKMESSTSVSFSTSTQMSLTLYFYAGNAGNKVKIDGTDYTIDSDGTVTVTVEAGPHEITKNSTGTYLFLVRLLPVS